MSQGYAASLDVDYPIASRFRLGWQMSVLGVTLKEESSKKSNPLLSAFLTIKYQIPIQPDRFFIEPQVAFGYGYLFEFNQRYASSAYFLESTALSPVYYLTPKFGLTGYVGLLWGQGGFGMVRDVSGDPLPIFQIGIVLK